MVPISGRIPDDLYTWLSALPLEEAATMSDKLRIAIMHLKRTHDGDTDYIDALSMYRDLGRGTREQIAQLERRTGRHSEVLTAFMEHLPALLAMLNASQALSSDSAQELEAILVKRTMQLAETLLRQAVTQKASAYDENVIHDNASRVIELARLISSPV